MSKLLKHFSHKCHDILDDPLKRRKDRFKVCYKNFKELTVSQQAAKELRKSCFFLAWLLLTVTTQRFYSRQYILLLGSPPSKPLEASAEEQWGRNSSEILHHFIHKPVDIRHNITSVSQITVKLLPPCLIFEPISLPDLEEITHRPPANYTLSPADFWRRHSRHSHGYSVHH